MALPTRLVLHDFGLDNISTGQVWFLQSILEIIRSEGSKQKQDTAITLKAERVWAEKNVFVQWKYMNSKEEICSISLLRTETLDALKGLVWFTLSAQQVSGKKLVEVE